MQYGHAARTGCSWRDYAGEALVDGYGGGGGRLFSGQQTPVDVKERSMGVGAGLRETI